MTLLLVKWSSKELLYFTCAIPTFYPCKGCVCVREREREWERENVCVCVCGVRWVGECKSAPFKFSVNCWRKRWKKRKQLTGACHTHHTSHITQPEPLTLKKKTPKKWPDLGTTAQPQPLIKKRKRDPTGAQEIKEKDRETRQERKRRLLGTTGTCPTLRLE